MNANDEELLRLYRKTIWGALLDAYFSAVVEPWKQDCYAALKLSGYPEDQFQEIIKRREKILKK